jgi:hypothetical protein
VATRHSNFKLGGSTAEDSEAPPLFSGEIATPPASKALSLHHQAKISNCYPFHRVKEVPYFGYLNAASAELPSALESNNANSLISCLFRFHKHKHKSAC